MNLQQNLVVVRGPIAAGKSSLVSELRSTITDSSIVDVDAIKRLIDNRHSSEWRRQIAFDVSQYMMRSILLTGRAIIAELHGSDTAQLAAYITMATEFGYRSTSVLLYPPLTVCNERAANRFVPDITYAIDHEMVSKHWHDTQFIPHEQVYDTSIFSTSTVASFILKQLSIPHD